MMSEQTVYGAAADSHSASEAGVETANQGPHAPPAQVEGRGPQVAMLTAYDYSTASVFDEAQIPVLLVGDSAANVVYGYDTTVPVTIDELIPLARGVVRGGAACAGGGRPAVRQL